MYWNKRRYFNYFRKETEEVNQWWLKKIKEKIFICVKF